MSDFLPLTNISGNSMVSFGMLFSNDKSNTTFFYQANLLDGKENITENLKEATKKGIEIDPGIEKLLEKEEVIIDTLYPYRNAGIVFAKGATTTLPNLAGSQEYIQFTEPRFTIGELVDLKKTGTLGYIIEIEFIKGEFDANSEWVYVVLPVDKFYSYGELIDKSSEHELNKIGTSERPAISVNFPQAKIGDLVETEEGDYQVVTGIKWDFQIDLREIKSLMEKDNVNLNPFYVYFLTRWDKEKKELKCLETSKSSVIKKNA